MLSRSVATQDKRKMASARDRDAAHGREYVGLHVRMPYAGWGGDYATSDEYETGTIVDYLTTTPAQFVVAFDPDLEWDDVRLSWSELLAERVYLESTLPAILLRRDDVPLKQLRPTGKAPRDTKHGGLIYCDPREAASWFNRRNERLIDRSKAAGAHSRVCPSASLASHALSVLCAQIRRI